MKGSSDMKKFIILSSCLVLAAFTACSDTQDPLMSIQAVTTTIEPIFIESKTIATEGTLASSEFFEQTQTISINESAAEDVLSDGNSETEESSGYVSSETSEESITTAEISSSVSESEKEEGNSIYIKTPAVPEDAYEYAKKMFSGMSKSDLVYMGFTSEEAGCAVLENGFCVSSITGNENNSFYFPVSCEGILTGLMLVTYENEKYGFQFGKDEAAAGLNDLVTSHDNAAEIYISGNAFYGVTDETVSVVSYMPLHNDNEIADEIAYLESHRNENGLQTDMIIVAYGNTDSQY